MSFGHVSEKTDAFAMGIIIIELLISEAIDTEDPATFPERARGLVETEDQVDLSAAVQAMAITGSWGDGGEAKHAAKVLADVAVSFTGKVANRWTPAQALARLEAAHGDLQHGVAL